MRKIRQSGPVWVTAVMTFAAGLPHVQCRCPDSTRLAMRPHATSQIGPRCCCGSCCLAHGTSPAADSEQPSGCCGRGQSDAGVQGRPCAIGCTGCQKTLATVELAVLGDTKKTATEKWAAELAAATPEPPLAAGGPASRNGPLIWQLDRSPPPDCIIVFRHLVI